jgi:hypothetical protein
MKHRITEIDWPEFGLAEPPARATAAEFQERLAAARAGMGRRGLSHLVVYADREHFAKLAYLTGFDPRFEEALQVMTIDGRPRDKNRLLRDIVAGHERIDVRSVSERRPNGK